MTDIDKLRQFYRCDNDVAMTLFDIWEAGAANGDSVTPSTYSQAYREWMVELICRELTAVGKPALLSIGCGNAKVETEVARAGFEVLAVDLLERAVQLARRKGLTAVQADIRTWTPERDRWGVVYADGLLGHVYDPDEGLVPILKHLHGWLAPGPGALIISNDVARAGRDAEAAPGVPVYWLSPGYVIEESRAAGFSDLSYATYTYTRPLSGPRDRGVVTARVHPTG